MEKIFSETDVTKLSGSWNEASPNGDFLYIAKLEIKKL